MEICNSFFFSSRRRHTRWNCDWSSDVCSSDLRRRVVDSEDLSGELPQALGVFLRCNVDGIDLIADEERSVFVRPHWPITQLEQALHGLVDLQREGVCELH